MALPFALFPRIAYAADAATRADALKRIVIGERDYVSAWLATTRNIWRMLGGKGRFQLVPPRWESRIGIDGMIVLEGSTFLKYLYFEAKWPYHGFDYSAKASAAALTEYGVAAPNYSHFSDQLGRQSQWLIGHPQDVIFEMFINDGSIIPCDPYGSTFVDHQTARGYVAPPGAKPVTSSWNPADVANICHSPKSVEDILKSLVACDIGQPIRHGERPNGYEFSIPTFDEMEGETETANRFLAQLEEAGIMHYAHFVGELMVKEKE